MLIYRCTPHVTQPKADHELSLSDVIAQSERMGTMPRALIDFADPLTILLYMEQHGDYTFAQ
jgi:hypothetical protein